MRSQRTVLAVVRTTTSLNRVLDVLPVVADDRRVEVVFAVDGGSAFGNGVARRLDDIGARTVPWSRALGAGFDLAVAASDKGDVAQLRCPLLLLRHGAGLHKRVPGTGQVSGLAPRVLGRAAAGGLRMVLAHEHERTLVAAVAPTAATTAVVAGDLCLDRLRLARADRDRYRALLGIGGNQRVVAVTSTWGERSALGRHPDLPARVLAELPCDEHRVVAALHPNVWARHGAFQVRQWLARAVDGGLLLLPPDDAWELGLVLADCVVGDHGSQTAYALDLGIPVLLAAFGAEEVVAGSPMADLGRRLPRLRTDQPAADQVAKVLATHEPADARALVAGVFACRDRALTVLRETVYDMLHLPPPAHPPRPRPIGPLPAPAPVPTAFHVEASPGHPGGTVVLRRFPAVVDAFGRWPARRHLAVEDVAAEPVLAESAAVVVRQVPFPDATTALDWAGATLARFPACRVVAAPGPGRDLVARVRGGPVLRVEVDAAAPGVDAAVLASAVHARLVADGAVPDGVTFGVRCGGYAAAVTCARLDLA